MAYHDFPDQIKMVRWGDTSFLDTLQRWNRFSNLSASLLFDIHNRYNLTQYKIKLSVPL